MFKPRKVTPEIESRILTGYASGLSARHLASECGVSDGCVLLTLRRNGIERRHGTARYQLDVDYFSTIDTEEKAYWLGFIAADGCVHEGRSGCLFSISVAVRDELHLKKLREALGFDGPLIPVESKSPTSGKMYPQVRLNINRSGFAAHLVSHGIVPRKSKSLKAPLTVPGSLLRHYWRGQVDGDGWLSVGRTRKTARSSGTTPMFNVGLLGTESIVRDFARFVHENTGVSGGLGRKGSANVWRYSSGGVKHPQMVTRLLYENATVFLDRKKETADAILSAPLRSNTLIFKGKAVTAGELERKIGRGPGTIQRRIKRGMSLEEAVAAGDMRVQRVLTHNGETLTQAEWSRRTGLSEAVIYGRLQRGYSTEQALQPGNFKHMPLRKRVAPTTV